MIYLNVYTHQMSSSSNPPENTLKCTLHRRDRRTVTASSCARAEQTSVYDGCLSEDGRGGVGGVGGGGLSDRKHGTTAGGNFMDAVM